MEEFFEQLKVFGFEKENVMGRFLDDEQFYLECYCQLVEDDGFEKLGKLLKEADRKKAFDCAHSLKGIAINMGIVSLFDKVSAVVEALRNEESRENPQELYEEMLVELEACRKALELVEE